MTATPPNEPTSAEPTSLAGSVTRALELLAATRSPGVRGDDPWPDAGRKVLRLHFARVLARVPGVIAGEDPEEVHVMRVASRRMRAAWRVFGDGFDRASTRGLRRDLREVGRRLGAVRDFDVLLGILDAQAGRRGPRARTGLAPLRAAWVEGRRARHEELVGFVSSPTFSGFVGTCEAFLATDGPADEAARMSVGRVRARMPGTAWVAYRDVWVFEERLPGGDLATLHQLRIAGKWLRYTLEFAREALGTDAAPLIEPVVALQDHLGEQHDLHVAATLARECLTAQPALTPKEAAQVERFVRDLDARVEWYGRRFPRTWQPLVDPRYRARLGRALARL